MIPISFGDLQKDNRYRSAYRRVRGLCFTREDAADFSQSLRAAFPTIRFVSVDYWQHFVDQERWKADCLESDRRWKLGLPAHEFRRHMREPAGESLHYWDSLANPAETRFYVWIEPSNWRPRWRPADDFGIRYIENTPRLWFQFDTSKYRPKFPRWLLHLDTEPPVGTRDTLALEGFEFVVRWHPNDSEAEAFGKKVYNILRKQTACEFRVFDHHIRRAFTAETERMQKMLMAGRHAIAWSLKRRHNYLKGDFCPQLFKPATYRLRLGDVFSKADLRQYRAREKAKFEAARRKYQEEMDQFSREQAKSGAAPSLDLLVRGTGGLSGLKMRVPIGKSSEPKS